MRSTLVRGVGVASGTAELCLCSVRTSPVPSHVLPHSPMSLGAQTADARPTLGHNLYDVEWSEEEQSALEVRDLQEGKERRLST